ncbi:MAG0490 family ComEA-like DNA-binding protein [Metamycoplasma auris]|uniref:Competence protein ComEA n=1 Tax=Metamycoplasma auris TaxID=51363 RepID=A0A2W7GCI1_9BACT|nr:SLBB domain-containing protein [Metamycoplasma auris]PZW01398.1 competence protein ComEA [Metamycoplasma auris]
MRLKFNKKKFFLATGIFLVSSFILISAIFIKKEILKNNEFKKTIKQDEYVTVNITGAIKYPGNYDVKKGTTYLELLKDATLKINADLNKIDKTKKIEKNEKIFIPFLRNKKIKLKDIKDYQTLVNLGIKTHIAKKVYSYIKEKEVKDWKELLQISGIGEKTYSILVANIDI